MSVPRKLPEINAGSMADIAFLLLVFFLVSTAIDQDAGIKVKLPAHVETPPPPPPKYDENVLLVQLNSLGNLLVEGKSAQVTVLPGQVHRFLLTEAESPQKAIVSLKGDRLTSYESYIAVHDAIRTGYRTARDEWSSIHYGRKYAELSDELRDVVKEEIPMLISEGG